MLGPIAVFDTNVPRLGFREGSDASVQRGLHAIPADRQAQPAGVGHQLMFHQPDAPHGTLVREHRRAIGELMG